MTKDTKNFKTNYGINVYYIKYCGGLAEESELDKWKNHEMHKNIEGTFYSLKKGFTYSFFFYDDETSGGGVIDLEYNDEEELVFVQKGERGVIIKPKNELDEYFFLKFKLDNKQVTNLARQRKVSIQFFLDAEEKEIYKIVKNSTNKEGYFPIKINKDYFIYFFGCDGCVKKKNYDYDDDIDYYDDVVSWEGHSLNENEEEGLKFYFLDKNLYRFSFYSEKNKKAAFVDLLNINEKESLACKDNAARKILFFKETLLTQWLFFKIKKETNDVLCQEEIFFYPFFNNYTLDNQTTNTKKNIQQKPNRLGWNLLFFLLVLIVIIIVIVGVVFFLTKIKKKKDFEKN